MSKVVSLRLKDEQVERLQRAARRLGRSPSEAAALLLEESHRQRDFAFVEFRDSAVGRQAYLQGTRLAIWQVAWLARSFGGDVAKVAAHLAVQVAAALRYAAAYRDEVDLAIADNALTATTLAQNIPSLEVIDVDAPAL
ncbi:MAG: transcriptional regulator [Chloroflexota bacterium]